MLKLYLSQPDRTRALNPGSPNYETYYAVKISLYYLILTDLTKQIQKMHCMKKNDEYYFCKNSLVVLVDNGVWHYTGIFSKRCLFKMFQ